MYLRLLKPYHRFYLFFLLYIYPVGSRIRAHDTSFFLRIFLKFQDITMVVSIKAKFCGFSLRNLLDSANIACYHSLLREYGKVLYKVAFTQ